MLQMNETASCWQVMQGQCMPALPGDLPAVFNTCSCWQVLTNDTSYASDTVDTMNCSTGLKTTYVKLLHKFFNYNSIE
jgi:hypothetical protein